MKNKMFPFHIHQTFSKKNVAEGFQKCEFGSLLFQWNKNSVVNPDVLRPDHRLKGDKCLEFVTDLSICRRQILLRQIVALLMPFFAIPPPILGDSQKVCSRNPIMSSDVYSSPDYAFLDLRVAYPVKF